MSYKKYLIIGASGMVGFRLARTISQKANSEVVGTWRSLELSSKEFSTVRINLTERYVGDFVREFKPDIVYHLACETNIDICEKYPERVYLPIQIGLFSLIDACNEVGSKLIFISTDGIFSQEKGRPCEDTLPTPVNVYGRGKVLSEGLVRSMSRCWVIVRCCPVGNNLLRHKSLVAWAEQQVKKKQSMIGWTDCYFSPLTVNTLVKQLVQLQNIDNQIVHLHSFPGISKYEFLCKLVEMFGGTTDLVRPGKMADAALKTPRVKNQILYSKGIPGIETAVPIEQEFEALKNELLGSFSDGQAPDYK